MKTLMGKVVMGVFACVFAVSLAYGITLPEVEDGVSDE